MPLRYVSTYCKAVLIAGMQDKPTSILACCGRISLHRLNPSSIVSVIRNPGHTRPRFWVYRSMRVVISMPPHDIINRCMASGNGRIHLCPACRGPLVARGGSGWPWPGRGWWGGCHWEWGHTCPLHPSTLGLGAVMAPSVEGLTKTPHPRIQPDTHSPTWTYTKIQTQKLRKNHNNISCCWPVCSLHKHTFVLGWWWNLSFRQFKLANVFWEFRAQLQGENWANNTRGKTLFLIDNQWTLILAAQK